MIVLEDITTHPPKGATVRSRKSGNLATVINRRRDVVDGQPVFLVTVDTGEKVAEVLLEAIEYPVIVETSLGAVSFDAGLRVGDRVTNDKDWDGLIERIDRSERTAKGDYQWGAVLSQTADGSTSADGLYYWVRWTERAQHKENLVAKQPICGHLKQEIWRKV